MKLQLGDGLDSGKKVFYLNEELKCLSGDLSLSDVADKICFSVYPKTIRVNNELINKDTISTAPIKKVRKTLIEQLLTHEDMGSYLSGTSAEATIYRALFVGTGIITGEMDGNAQIVLDEINSFIDKTAKEKKNLSKLINTLTQALIGIRKGIIPIYLV